MTVQSSRGSYYDPGNSSTQYPVSGIKRSNPTTYLDWNVDSLHYVLQYPEILRMSRASTIQINYVKSTGSLALPSHCYLDRIVREHRFLVELPLNQAYTAPTDDIYRRYYFHKSTPFFW
jgi:hypothetical protein